ncbi:hypothetical protein AAVH_27408, partial [Aphelenchoides avenae]
MSRIFAVLCCALAFGAASATSRDNVIMKTRNLVTTFLSTTQCGQVWDSIAVDLYNLKTTAYITSNLKTKILGTLGSTQLMTAMGIYNRLTSALGGLEKANICFDKVLYVLNNNIGPLGDQVRTKMTAMKANGRTQAACVTQAYYMFDLYLTFDRVKTLLTRVKGKLLVSEWAAIRKETSTVMLWS